MTPMLRAEHISVLAEGLAKAEDALDKLAAGQIDAVITPDGRAYLLRPAQENLRRSEARLQTMLDQATTILAEMKATHRQLMQEDRVASALASLARDRFLAVLGHELRTPLTPALLGLAILKNDPRFSEAIPDLAMIERNLEFQMRLLDDLADFTAAGQQKLRVHLEPTDAHDIVHSVLVICEGEIAASRIQVVLDLQASKHIVQADTLRLPQILWNLIKNAVKFSIPGGCVSLSSFNDASGGLMLQLVDRGIGIEPEFLPRIFDPFEQSHRALHQHSGGLGLGMFIAKSLADAQEATLTVSSEGLHHGTTFQLGFKNARARDESPPSAAG